MKRYVLLLSLLTAFGSAAQAQYNTCAGQNRIVEYEKVEVTDEVTGRTEVRQVAREVATDSYGNADGNQYDLAIDGAFDGQTIVVLHLYTGEGFDFEKPKKALQEKGFSVYRFVNQVPDPKTLKEALDKACQLWVISNTSQQLNGQHVEVIREFFDAGHGVYIWGDNDPYHADADYLAKSLVGASMSGYYMGDTNVGIKDSADRSGLKKGHLITTGIEHVYEGITISTIHDQEGQLEPLIWSSDGNVVASTYEKDGKRLILDGGFTRLYYKWDTAGTGRYVKNAAAWLVNYEKFGDEVVSEDLKREDQP